MFQYYQIIDKHAPFIYAISFFFFFCTAVELTLMNLFSRRGCHFLKSRAAFLTGFTLQSLTAKCNSLPAIGDSV